MAALAAVILISFAKTRPVSSLVSYALLKGMSNNIRRAVDGVHLVNAAFSGVEVGLLFLFFACDPNCISGENLNVLIGLKSD